MLFFTGFSRYASEIAQKQIDNFGHKAKELQTLGQFADDAMSILQGKGELVTNLGRLMHEAWELKRISQMV